MEKKYQDLLKVMETKQLKSLLGPNEELFLSCKISKFNPYNWLQERSLILTSQAIYNLKKYDLQRKILISSVGAITRSSHKESTEFVVHVPSEYDYRYTSPNREEIIEIIKNLYFKITKKMLPMYEVPIKALNEYVTNKDDKKKSIFKIPDEKFRIKMENLSISEEAFPNLEVKSQSLFKKMKEDNNNLDCFKVIKKIGKGNFGQVYMVEEKTTGKVYAMKVLRKDKLIAEDQIQSAKLEKDIMQNANHPFLIGMEFVFQTTYEIYFIMKFMQGGELFTHLGRERRFAEPRVVFYVAQIVMALGHLHKHKIIYRDIKPENILMDEKGYVAIADFGLARFIKEGEPAKSFCGTPEYVAPEIITGEGHNGCADWWGVGILIYELLVGIPPFYHKNQNLMFQQITTKSVIFPDPVKHKIPLSDEAKDIITKLLNKNQKERLGAKNDALDLIGHPFFKSLNIEELMERKVDPALKPKLKDKYDLSYFDVKVISEEGNEVSGPISKLELIKKFDEEFKDFN